MTPIIVRRSTGELLFSSNGASFFGQARTDHLADFARRNGVRVETILPLRHTPTDRRRAGYAHLTGDAKRDPVLVAGCERRLARDYPAEYRAFLAGWKRVGESVASVPAGGSYG